MNISFESRGDFGRITKWLQEASVSKPERILKAIASEGTKSLEANTPRETGETASGWVEQITQTGDVTEIAWLNIAHPEQGVSIAKLIELGHGTGTGGYVQPQPYIKKAMKPVWAEIDNKVIKELIK